MELGFFLFFLNSVECFFSCCGSDSLADVYRKRDTSQLLWRNDVCKLLLFSFFCV